MKKFIIWAISVYQVMFSSFLRHLLGSQAICRYSISCSEYTKLQIIKYGSLKGIVLGLRRIITCQPYFSL